MEHNNSKNERGKKVFKCLSCGNVFTEDEIEYVEESRGEFWGMPCTERMAYSPCCGDDFEELEPETRTIKVTAEMLKVLGRPYNIDSHEDAMQIVNENVDLGEYEIITDAEFTIDDASEIDYTVEYTD